MEGLFSTNVGNTGGPASSPFLAPNGSAAAPAYAFSGDTASGIYWANGGGGHQVIVSNNGQAGAVFDANGMTFVTAASTTVYELARSVNTASIRIEGGTGSSAGYFQGYGATHATKASVVELGNTNGIALSINSTGQSAFSTAADTATALLVSNGGSLTGTTNVSINAFTQFPSTCTSEGDGVLSTPRTAAAAFTMARLFCFSAGNPTIGSGSSVSRFANYYGDVVTSGGNNAFLTDTKTFGAGNWFIYSTQANDSLISGNFVLNIAGNGFKIKEGTNAKMGTGTLNGATEVTISTTAVTASSRIFLSIQAPGGTPSGAIYVSSRSAGTSFGVKSLALDSSTFAWCIIEPA